MNTKTSLYLILILMLAGCYPYPTGPALPLDLQATSISRDLQATQEMQSYNATQTPYVATQSAVATQIIIDQANAQTQTALSVEQTQVALQLAQDQATQSAQETATQRADNATATQEVRSVTATAVTFGATQTQRVEMATATQTALDLQRQESTNLALGWTPIVIAVVFALAMWRLFLVFENRRSAFETQSGELIFNRRYSVPLAILMAYLRQKNKEIAFDDFIMPGRAPGHATRDQAGGYQVNKDNDREAQLAIIQQEQLRRLYSGLPSGPQGLPQLPAYASDIIEAGAIDIIPAEDRSIAAWVADVENLED